MDLFESEIEKLRVDLVKKYNELGMRASGEWEKQLEAIIEITESNIKATFYGIDYTEYLVKGRTPGKFPPRDKIRQWIDDKGITPKDNITKDQLAFLIARKISKEGTKYFKQGGTDLIDSVITMERIREIVEVVGRSFLTTFEFKINEKLIRQ